MNKLLLCRVQDNVAQEGLANKEGSNHHVRRVT
jgi:hypothetical protein